MKPKIVVLDSYTLNPGDLSWAMLEDIGRTSIYDRTPDHLVLERAADAEIIVVNKQIISPTTMAALPKLKFIAVSATGYNNVDMEAANSLGIKVANVAGYGTTAVAQHVFALLLALISRVREHSSSVKKGDWSQQKDFSYTLGSIPELSTLKMGIYGFGRIGQAVARIALAFGMEVLAHHKHPKRDFMAGVRFVSLEELFNSANVVSLHAPLSAENKEIVDASRLSSMPAPAYLINTGRGGLIKEADLADCLKRKIINGAGLDVLQQEPPQSDHPLMKLENCIITPHMAWATYASRQRLLNEVIENIRAYLRGEGRNLI